jgi:hypothetical protein
MALAVNQGPVSTPTPENAVVLLIDHQRGLAEWVRDQSPVEFKTAVMGLARTPKTLGIPVIITTSRDFGPNGMLLPEHTGAGRSARICLPRWACHGDRVDLLLRSPTVAPADRQVPDRAGLAGLHAPRPGAHRARGQEIRLFEHTRVTVRRRPPPLRQPDVLLQPNTDKEREQ